MTCHHKTLTFGCPSCIEVVKRDQWIAALPEMSDRQLLETLIGRDHIEEDWMRDAAERELGRREAKKRAAS